jgi:xylan 1,4-beta-xylosidase
MVYNSGVRTHRFLPFLCVLSAAAQPVSITVHANETEGPFRPIFRYFGYDEPNYTYAANGRKLVGELAAVSAAPTYIRAHHLLTTGDGEAAFKWGSTNAYTEDAAGKPVYTWTVVDRILDTWVQSGARPFVELGFMPQALSTKPDPYVPVWSPGANFDRYYVGWAYPPKDYDKWGELVYQLARHAVEKYGRASVENWYWEVWNEPDIAYWHGTPEEYDKLYDASAAAVKRALPTAKVGGPASTGPAGAKAAAFLRQFLEHCDKSGVPLDFITFHAKGRPTVVDGHVRMGIAKNLEDAETGFRIVASFPKVRSLPIVLSESDPEGCAACSARVYPQNAYRNGTLYAAYTALAMKSMTDLAKRDGVNLEGMLTWAFEFEGQPYFDGFRTLATNGLDKPVLNYFRMAGLMSGDRVRVESDAALPLDTVVKEGVGAKPDVDAIAARADRKLTVLVWNYQDNDIAGQPASVALKVVGLAAGVDRVSVRQFRIDQDHSNAYTAWKRAGSPQQPTPEQYAALEAAGQLQTIGSPQWLTIRNGAADIHFDLPLQGLSLIELTW